MPFSKIKKAKGIPYVTLPNQNKREFFADNPISKKERKEDKKLIPVKPGAIYISRLPFGFYEHALEHFFMQFGKITRLKVARSEKTAQPMGWAYIEFKFENVAKIAAHTMHDYFLYGKRLQCRFISSNRINDGMFASPLINRATCNSTVARRENQIRMVEKVSPKFTSKRAKKILAAKRLLHSNFGVDVGLKKNEIKGKSFAKKRNSRFSDTTENTPESRKTSVKQQRKPLTKLKSKRPLLSRFAESQRNEKQLAKAQEDER